ncbi:energy transducer TonB [Pseudoduganella armeniaca]|nr:energy transducer TonB [Pseudoduganella armeniaca]
MDFTAHRPKKNPAGIAVVVLLHLGAALVALHNNTISLHRVVPPGVIDVLVPPPVEPPPLPEPVPLPTPSSPPPIAVPPIQDFVPQQPPPQLTTRSTAEPAPPSTPAGASASVPTAEPAARAAPVRVAPVVDARACKRPDYPRNALRNGETGTVTLALRIGTDGKVMESKVESSSGSRELDRAAQAGLSLCRFQPGTVDGVAYESWTRMQYVWNLDE